MEKARASEGCPKVYAAFVDYTQAYDSVNRQALWAHLQSLHVPSFLLEMLKEIYSGDAYVVVDGHRKTPAVQPVKGVKQGCPLSPLLFALFLNDFESKMGQAIYDLVVFHCCIAMLQATGGFRPWFPTCFMLMT